MCKTDSLSKALHWDQTSLYIYLKKFKVGSERTQKRRKRCWSTTVVLHRFDGGCHKPTIISQVWGSQIFLEMYLLPYSFHENMYWETQLCGTHSEKSTSTPALRKQSAHVRPGRTAAPLTFLARARLTPGRWREAARLLARTGAHFSPGTTLSFLSATAVVTWDYRQRETSSFEISYVLVQLWNNTNCVLPKRRQPSCGFTVK